MKNNYPMHVPHIQYCERGLFFLKTAIFKWKKNKNGKFLPQIKNILLQILPTANFSTVPLLYCHLLTLPSSQILWEKARIFNQYFLVNEKNCHVLKLRGQKYKFGLFSYAARAHLGYFLINKEQIEFFKELKEHFSAQTVL